MSPLVAPGRHWTQGVTPQGTMRSGVPGSEPRAAGHGRWGEREQGQRESGQGGAPAPPPGSPHLRSCSFQARLQVTPAIVTQGPHHHLPATSGPWGHKEQPQAHLLPGKGGVSTKAMPGLSIPAPDPFWPCLLEGHPMGLQLEDTTEQGVVGSQGDEARLGQPQAVVDGERGGRGTSRKLQADTTGQGHRAALGGYEEAE